MPLLDFFHSSFLSQHDRSNNYIQIYLPQATAKQKTLLIPGQTFVRYLFNSYMSTTHIKSYQFFFYFVCKKCKILIQLFENMEITLYFSPLLITGVVQSTALNLFFMHTKCATVSWFVCCLFNLSLCIAKVKAIRLLVLKGLRRIKSTLRNGI